LSLRGNKWCNFFLYVLSELLEICPVVKELLALFNLRFF
jgi:hypothetical protein